MVPFLEKQLMQNKRELQKARMVDIEIKVEERVLPSIEHISCLLNSRFHFRII